MKIVYLPLLLCFLGCTPPQKSPLEIALSDTHPAIIKVMQDPSYYEVQVIYTEITTLPDGEKRFLDHTFQLDKDRYFYPASTVKLPAAVLALERISNHPEITKDTPYVMLQDSIPHTIGDDIRQIFAVSDNDAYNRLYEFLGRDVINTNLEEKGIYPVRISHRLSVANAANSVRAPLLFVIGKDSVSFTSNTDKNIFPLSIKRLKKGKGFYKNDTLVATPMDFAKKNYFPLQSQHDLMKRIFFPEEFSSKEQFQLSKENLAFLKEQMSTLPRNNGYDEQEYYDSYGKFFIYGDTQNRIPNTIKIYNKVGYAYGTLTDTAYIVDELEQIEFLVSATILVNKNGIFNDNEYEYDEIGMPFLAQLGRSLYRYEQTKK